MDIDILLGLQQFREGAGAFLTEFLRKMTFFGKMNVVLLIVGVIYWCVSKEFGNYFLMGWSGNRIVNGLLKVTFCAYRPWIRDTRIFPHDEAKLTATGYSFPSGHSMNGASLFSGGAIRKDLPRALRIALGLLGFYAVSLVLGPLIKSWIPGAAGTALSCFLQMFYVSFLFPWCIKRFFRE